MKRCTKCHEEKDNSSFVYVKARGKLHSWCKLCHTKAAKEHYWKNRERICRKSREANSKPLNKYKRYVFERLKLYGLTEQDMRDMMDNQRGCCAICKNSLDSGKKQIPQVDHCHRTGKVRGLLCDICNVGLGHFKDNPLLLEEAKQYVTRHNTEN